jgi:hypothetical protein
MGEAEKHQRRMAAQLPGRSGRAARVQQIEFSQRPRAWQQGARLERRHIGLADLAADIYARDGRDDGNRGNENP